MGTITQYPRSADAGRGGFVFLRRSVASLTLACTCVFSSATARAGIHEIPPEVSSISRMPQSTPMADISSERAVSALPSIADASVLRSAVSDPLCIDPARRATLLGESSGIWKLPPSPAIEVVNATPKTQATQPLLIPLPNAVSTGALGLAALGVFGTAKRLRRRLFA